MPRLTLALDLEDTLITPLVQHDYAMMSPGPFRARPGLRKFLDWALGRFDLAVFTGVPKLMSARVLAQLVEEGHAPEAFGRVRVLRAMDADGNTQPDPRGEDMRVKDLTRTGPLGTVLMLDDCPAGYCVPGQEAYWIQIPEVPRKRGGLPGMRIWRGPGRRSSRLRPGWRLGRHPWSPGEAAVWAGGRRLVRF